MKKKEAKLEKTLNTMPKRKEFVERIFSRATSSQSKKTDVKNCLKLAQDRLEKMIGPLV
ncbi:MAG: hypothetical protein Q7T11_09510 [Deltaproteobacteria bacterium]|nr:hypothetical protein [Deltaproteobacteria bacterium]